MKQLKAGDTFRECEACPEMVVVPAGSFIMGAPEDDKDINGDEIPQHKVTIFNAFAVGKYEVTRGQYRTFVDETRYNAGKGWLNPEIFKQKSDAHPVISVSWDDAQAYICWLSEKAKHQYRLLSEAEWEYAARAGTSTSYYLGDTITLHQGSYDGTVAVGSYPANNFGLHDMHSNIWEWVEDCWHNDYEGAPTDGSAWVSDCDLPGHVLRGSSLDNDSEYPRYTDRDEGVTDDRCCIFSFRVARTLESLVL